jgi:predicted Zn-dependent peptidase
MGDAFDVRDPTALLVQAHLPPGGEVAPVLGTVAQECDRLAADGLQAGELARTVARMATHLLRESDTVLSRALTYGVVEQQRGDAGLADALLRLLGEVTEEQVRAAAASLGPSRRAVVEVMAGGGER